MSLMNEPLDSGCWTGMRRCGLAGKSACHVNRKSWVQISAAPPCSQTLTFRAVKEHLSTESSEWCMFTGSRLFLWIKQFVFQQLAELEQCEVCPGWVWPTFILTHIHTHFTQSLVWFINMDSFIRLQIIQLPELSSYCWSRVSSTRDKDCSWDSKKDTGRKCWWH